MKINEISSYSFTYLFIVLCYLEEYYQINYNTLKEFINDESFINEIDWHLSKMENEKIINKNDNVITINKDFSPLDIMYIIKVNIKKFNNMARIVNEFMMYEYEKEKVLMKKKTV